ncbi:hypothetical protein HZ989_10410 [Brevundimonas sp. AJA228-03]|uniref:hypothetical protein n=1 Tax=Brevundimonas sp. AJA228-03 TaxID=2752515 RepID=UPI001ADF0BB2|nr:hypothetical protein [Brevundimonas sp. AJA228-03]QTN18662.1 hypothetical protein HZ989_10410 [Brevundimonas sp. AJA228-03]
MTALIAGLLALAFVSQTAEQTAALNDAKRFQAQMYSAYHDCVSSEARRLEPSGDAADSVVEAAMTSCAQERRDLLQISIPVLIIEHDLQEGQTSRAITTFMNGLDDGVRSAARLAVIEARTARNSRQ